MSKPDSQAVLGAVVTVVTICLSTTVLLNVCKKAYHVWRLRRLAAASSDEKTEKSPHATVTGLFIHPVKSLRAVSLEEAEIDQKGLVDDRRFMAVHELPLPPYREAWEPQDVSHRFLSQRICPSLATVIATLEGSQLILEHDVIGPKKGDNHKNSSTNISPTRISISLGQSGDKVRALRAGIWDDDVVVQDMGDEAAAFVQAIVSADENCAVTGKVRLVCHSLNDRAADPKYTPPYAKSWWGSAPLVSLTDGYPILIASEASLAELNERLMAESINNSDGDAGAIKPIPMNRFRPNIVVAGDGLKPFEEDHWRVIAIGDVLFALVKGCPRCKQSCTDQKTGEVSDQPVKVMKSFRIVGNNKEDVYFAQNAIPLLGMMSGNKAKKGKNGLPCIRVGDPVRVLERGDPIFNAWSTIKPE